ncbi:MAG TPA: putative ATP-grasp-modified RiPP [Streptosporangiaceae bacterium]|nr:putative ATP-grasp-modified RiPP [Streptosporangiaceae bacterium]
MTSRALWRPEDMFPLSAPTGYGHLATTEPVKGGGPFGLRYLVDPDPGANCDLDLASVRLDDAAQIAMTGDGPRSVPVFKHTNNQTSTTTNVHDRKTSDSDTDYEQDK